MILIGLGANQDSAAGAPAQTFKAALERLCDDGGVRVLALSRLYRSPAWPDPAQPEFTNAAAVLESGLGPAALLSRLHAVEAWFGRVRSVPNAPRPLDLDLLDYQGQVMEGEIVLPHPRLPERAFVLLPLIDVAPGWRHPLSGMGLDEMIAALPLALKLGVDPV